MSKKKFLFLQTQGKSKIYSWLKSTTKPVFSAAFVIAFLLSSPHILSAETFDTNALVSPNPVSSAAPSTYTVDFGLVFTSISEVDYLTTFFPLFVPGECFFFTNSDFPGAFGFINISDIPQSTRKLSFPCSIFRQVCDSFLDGVVSGQVTVSLNCLSSPNPPISNNVVMTIIIEGTIATFESTLNDIHNFLELGLIDNQGIANALSRKIEAASNANAIGNTQESRDDLNAFKHQVSAQTSKHINGNAPQVLQRDADSLLSQLPQ